MEKKWHCPHCTQVSTRRWNVEVHISRKHGRAGYPVEIDGSSLNSRFVPDVNLKNNNHFGPYPYLNSFSVPRQQRAASSEKNSGPFDKIRESVRETLEWALQWVEFKNSLNELSSPSLFSPGGISLGHTSYIEWLFLQSFTPSTDPLRDRTVGYKGLVCEACLASLVLPIYRFNDTGIEVECKHICNNKRLSMVQGIADKEKEIMLQNLHRKLPEEIKKAVKQWTDNNNK
jgi:hypothetical protein